jgi:hypothetical protein
MEVGEGKESSEKRGERLGNFVEQTSSKYICQVGNLDKELS